MSSGAAEPSPSRRWPITLLRAAVTLVVLALLIRWLGSDALLAAVRRAPLTLWLGVLLGLGCGHLVAAMKWRLFCSAAGAPLGSGETLRAHAAGLFANLCLPSIVGGDVVRAGMVARGRDLAAIALGSLTDRLVDTAVLVLLAAIGAALAPTQADAAPVLRALGAATALVLICGLVAPVGVLWIPDSLVPVPARGIARKVRDALREIGRHPGAAGTGFALSFGVQASFVWLNAQLGAGVGIAVPLAVWYLAWPLAKIAGLLPLSLGGLGVREAALASLLAPFGVAGAAAVGQGLLWQAALISLGLLCGGAVLVAGRFSPRAEEPMGEAPGAAEVEAGVER